MFVPDIRQPSLKIRGAEASAEPISVITDAVLDVRQNHGLARGGRGSADEDSWRRGGAHPAAIS